jgi:hypothetical protein
VKSVIYKSTCQKCGQEIELGRAKYDVRVEVVSDFDGFLPEFDDEEDEMERALKDAEAKDARALEDDVHQEFALVLCRACMHEVLAPLRDLADGESDAGGGPPVKLH